MKVGIYNRWLATLGGGEQHSLALAEALSQSHEVTLISHVPVSRDEIRARLALDCARLHFATIPDKPAAQLGAMTANYALFINASQGDFVPNLAPHGAMLVFFPLQIDLDAAARVRAALGRRLREFLLMPEFAEGVFGPENAAGGRFRRLARESSLTVPASPAGADLTFDLAADPATGVAATVSVDGRMAVQRNLPADGTPIPCRVRLPAARQPRRVTIKAAGGQEYGADTPVMRLANVVLHDPRQRLYRWLFERTFKAWGQRLRAIQPEPAALRRALDSYGTLWANSEYTRMWITRYWQRDADILPPRVNVDRFTPAPKRNIILSVGRFFEGSHNKKHDVMIAAFTRLVADGLRDWELHLAGSVGEDPLDGDYLRRIQRMAAGNPIHLHANVPAEELTSLYNKSALYWHAGGYGEDEARAPIKSEHFGITTVEAMAAGCVPVVIAKGGQPEIVRHGENGYVWRTLAELQSATLALIRDPGLRATLASAARASSARYDRAHFEARVAALMAHLA